MLLDSSAVLAYLNREPGWPEVEPLLLVHEASISSVNLSEVIGKLLDNGVGAADATAAIDALQLDVVPFGVEEGILAGQMRADTRRLGLSLGDRACLATAKLRNIAVLTADRPWLAVAAALALDVRCIRPGSH